jgi:methionine sulfoxide reductase heme-binding subunit
MIDQALWVVGRGTGITALALFTLSIVLGIATRSGRQLLTLPRFAVVDVHRFAALLATVFVALHVGNLLADPYAQLRLIDIVIPFLGAYQPFWLGLGTVALDLLIAVVATSLLRHRLGLRAFRATHWATYAMWPIAVAHSMGNGTDSSHRWFVLFAGGCAMAVAVTFAVRLRADFIEYSDRRVRRQ